MLLYIIAAEVLAFFNDAVTWIKGAQIGNHEIKLVNFADDTTIFLRDIKMFLSSWLVIGYSIFLY